MSPNIMALVSLAILVLSCVAEDGHFNVHPRNETIDQGDNVTLTCKARSAFECPSNLRWLRYTHQGNSPEYVAYCDEKNITLEGRLNVYLDMNDRLYNLTILDVQPEDAGEYWCEIYHDCFTKISSSRTLLTVHAVPTTGRSSWTAASGQRPDDSTGDTISLTVTMKPHQISTSTFGKSDKNVPPPTMMTTDHGGGKQPATTTVTMRGTDGNFTDHEPYSTKEGQDQSPSATTPLKEFELNDETDERTPQGFPVWIIVGGALGLVFLLIVVASCASYLATYEGKVAKRPNGGAESGVQEAPREEETVATTTVLQINPIYDGLSQDTEGHSELGNRAASSDEAEEAMAATYAVPDKTGRGEVRHFTVSPSTNDGETDPGLVSSSLVSKEAASMTKGGVPSENAAYATPHKGSQTLSTSAASKAPRANSTPPRRSNKSASPEVFETQQIEPEYSYAELGLPCPPTAQMTYS